MGQFKARYSRRTEIIALAVFVVLCLAVGFAGTGITLGNIHRWYLTLTPPPLNPPVWAFAPAWTTLYILMGVAAWLIWRQPDLAGKDHAALLTWGWQLALNGIWAPIFFGLHLILLALVINILLFAAVAATIARFRPLSTLAALLMAPYLAWMAFALYLNAGFWWLNR